MIVIGLIHSGTGRLPALVAELRRRPDVRLEAVSVPEGECLPASGLGDWDLACECRTGNGEGWRRRLAEAGVACVEIGPDAGAAAADRLIAEAKWHGQWQAFE